MKTFLRSLLCILLALTAVFSCASCSMKIGAAELTAGYYRIAEDAPVPDGTLSEAAAALSLSVLKQITKNGDGNDLFSPITLLSVLSMIGEGAQGETLTQLEGLLGHPVSSLHGMLYSFRDSLPEGVTAANSVWFRDVKGFSMKESYLQSLADWYGAPAYLAPFDQSTLDDINRWANSQTKGLVPKVLDSITAEDTVYLLSSLLFDRKWEKPYEKKDVREGIPFRSHNGTEQNVTMLRSEETVYLSSETFGLIGFARPYKGGDTAFVGLVPKEGDDLYEVLGRMSGEDLLAIWNARADESVSVTMPEFSFDAGCDLIPAMRALGVTDLFDGKKCDLTGAAEFDPEENLYVGLLKQKNRIELDRNGTKAASVTIGGMKQEACMEVPNSVVLDRPFLFMIVDLDTGIPLFLGTVGDMAQAK